MIARTTAIVFVGLLGLGAALRPWMVVRRVATLRALGQPWPDVAGAIWTLRQAALMNAGAPIALLLVMRPWEHEPVGRRWLVTGVLMLAFELALAVNNARATERLLDGSPEDRCVRRGVAHVITSPGLALVPLAWPLIAVGPAWRAATVVVGLGLVNVSVARWPTTALRVVGLLGELPAAVDLVPVASERIRVLRSPVAEAIAVPWTNEVLVTTTLLRTLTVDELRLVHRREVHLLAHGRRRLLRWVGAQSVIVAGFASLARPWPLLAVVYGLFPALLLMPRDARSKEAGADAFAAQGSDPEAYAQVLVRTQERALVPVDVRSSPSGSLDERLRRLGVAPPYATPVRSAAAALRVLYAALLLVVVISVALLIALDPST